MRASLRRAERRNGPSRSIASGRARRPCARSSSSSPPAPMGRPGEIALRRHRELPRRDLSFEPLPDRRALRRASVASSSAPTAPRTTSPPISGNSAPTSPCCSVRSTSVVKSETLMELGFEPLYSEARARGRDHDGKGRSALRRDAVRDHASRANPALARDSRARRRLLRAAWRNRASSSISAPTNRDFR